MDGWMERRRRQVRNRDDLEAAERRQGRCEMRKKKEVKERELQREKEKITERIAAAAVTKQRSFQLPCVWIHKPPCCSEQASHTPYGGCCVSA